MEPLPLSEEKLWDNPSKTCEFPGTSRLLQVLFHREDIKNHAGLIPLQGKLESLDGGLLLA